MAVVYVSYKSTEKSFVESVVDILARTHDIRIDYKLRRGVAWRQRSLEELRDADVFLVFVSRETRSSAFQNAEIGAARFCARFADNKAVLPVWIDETECETLDDFHYINATHRIVTKTAKKILAEIEGLPSRVRLFISHAHLDVDLATKLIEVIASHFEVPDGELRCSSVPGYQLNMGTNASEALQRELGSACAVIALITPNSLTADWVRFELGAAWANARVTIPLLAGGLEDKDIPGPFRGAAGGQLKAPETLNRLLEQLKKELGWRTRKNPIAKRARGLTKYAGQLTFNRRQDQGRRTKH